MIILISAYTHQFWVSDQIWTLYHTVLVDSSPKILYACHPLLSCRIPFQCFCSWAHQGWSCASSQWDQQWLLSRDQRHVWSLYNPHPCLAVLDIMKRGDWREILHIPRRQPATPWMLFLEDVITWKHVIIQKKKPLEAIWAMTRKPSVGKRIIRPIIGSHNICHNLQITWNHLDIPPQWSSSRIKSLPTRWYIFSIRPSRSPAPTPNSLSMILSVTSVGFESLVESPSWVIKYGRY